MTSFFDRLFKRLPDILGGRTKETGIKEAGGGGTSAAITNSNVKNFIIKHVGWSDDNDDFQAPENDLTEVKSAIETDSYLRIALEKMSQLIFKSGFKYETESSEYTPALEYLEQRLALMEFGTGIPWPVLLNEIARNLVFYSNVFIVKSRADKIMGGLQAKPILGNKPIGGLFIMDPTAVEIKRDKSGAVKGYKLTGSNEKTFKAEDVVHIYIDRNADSSFGQPRVSSVLEDLKILRKLEGLCSSLCYRYATPLMQVKIGLPEPNLMATNQEISDCQKQLNSISLQGILVTNERTQIMAVGAEGKALDLAPYLSYFEKRIFAGLNVSESMMGRNTYSDSDKMEGLMYDTVKFYQSTIATFIEQIFNEILMEGGFMPIMNKEDRVKFVPRELNLDSRVKLENHLVNMYQNNVISLEELRAALGRNPEVDEGRLYTNLITTPSQIEVVQAKLGEGNNLTNGKTSSKNGNGQAKSVVAPTNQHGTTSAKIGESLEMTESAEKDIKDMADSGKRDRIVMYRLQYAELFNLYKAMRNNICRKQEFSRSDIDRYIEEFSREFDVKINEYCRTGYNTTLSSATTDYEEKKGTISAPVIKACHKQVRHMVKDIAAKVNRNGSDIERCIDYMEYRLRFACEVFFGKAYNLGALEALKSKGVTSVKLKLTDSHKDKKSVVKLDDFNIDDIPPFNAYCSCRIMMPEANTNDNII